MYARVVSEAVTGHQGFEMCVPIFRRVGLEWMRGGKGSPCQVIFRNEKGVKEKNSSMDYETTSHDDKGAIYSQGFFSCVSVAANGQLKSGVREQESG